MSALAVVATVVGVFVAVGLLTSLMLTRRALAAVRSELAEVRDSLADLREQTLPLLADTRSALRKADRDNRKADALLSAATSLTGTADAASKLAYRAVTNPFVRAAALVTGTKRAAKEFATPSSEARTRPNRTVVRVGERRKSVRAIDVRSSEVQPRNHKDNR